MQKKWLKTEPESDSNELDEDSSTEDKWWKWNIIGAEEEMAGEQTEEVEQRQRTNMHGKK